MSEIIELAVTNGIPTTTSLAVAERFGKRHGDVLRAIEGLDCSNEFTERNFAFSAYKDSTGRALPMHHITKDGFMFLAMGFNGKEAGAWKERYIAAFNVMEASLRDQVVNDRMPKPSDTLFLSHAADIMVAADRTFRAVLRSSRTAGLSLPAALRRAQTVALEKTGVNMLDELQAHDHVADLEAKASAQAASRAAGCDSVQSHPSVQGFWASWQSGSLGEFVSEPILSQHLYRLYLHWCGQHDVRFPLNFPRLVNQLSRAGRMVLLRKRYSTPDGALRGPVGFVFPPEPTSRGNQPETVWLGECVHRANCILESIKA